MTERPPAVREHGADPPFHDRPIAARLPPAILVAALFFGLVCGAFEITNTSIGWHLASGRWMLEHCEVLDHDLLSFTSGGVEWINHEWLFQILAAGIHELGGAPLLVAMRMLVVAALTLLLLRVGTAGGLDPPVALLLATACVWAARPRFFLRPELFTLLLVPLALWLFATRDERRLWPLPLAAVVAVGANLHGAILVVPVLVAAWFAGEVTGWLIRRDIERPLATSGVAGVIAAALAPMLTPFGWKLYTVPFTLAGLVRQPHIPNPEWIPPGPADAPALYVALVVAAIALAFGRRTPAPWFSLVATAALALKHIRNIGLFFVLLPQILAPALARWPVLAAADIAPNRRRTFLALVLVTVMAGAVVLRPWPQAGFTFADRWYPDRAYAFLEREALLDGPLYNDVRFGGWLSLHAFPERRVFLDDRNEIHEPLLEEIWKIFQASDVAAWERLLERWQVDAAMVRYHEPIRVTTPDGTELGRRGFSSLWFPPRRWALVYWDDAALVLVRRSAASQLLIDRREYRVLRPDDLEHLMTTLAAEPETRSLARAELDRALADDPGCERALELSVFLESLTAR